MLPWWMQDPHERVREQSGPSLRAPIRWAVQEQLLNLPRNWSEWNLREQRGEKG